MKKSIAIFLMTLVCMAFLCITTSAEKIKGYDTVADNANSWRYENGKPIVDPYGIVPIYISEHPNATLKGIDVSHHQGQINWEKVKAAGIDYAIIRCGFAEDKPEYDDRYWEYNVSECERLNIPYGVYLYSYATSIEDALSEADHVLRLIEGYNLSFPVYLDMEDNTTINSDLTGIATAFCNKISAAGYPVGIYANLNWWTYYLNDPCFNNWYRWVAHWNETCGYQGEYAMWQYGSTGIVDGINTNVDTNYLIGTPDNHKGWKEKLESPLVTLSIDSDSHKPFLNWSAVDGADEYQVWRKTEESRYSLYNTTENISMTDVGAEEGNVYYYKVKAVSSDKNKGNSYFSGEKSILLQTKEMVRIAGETRYETSIAIADAIKEKMGVEKFDTIIIASGLEFPDALAGSYLAKVKSAPILMANGSDKNDNLLKGYVDQNLAPDGTIYILGGDAAVPYSLDEIFSEYNVKRLAGTTRYTTNIAILKEAGVTNEEILVCTADNFADSLSASAVGNPILLVNGSKNVLKPEQKEYLETLGTSKYYIIGGTAAINEELATEISKYGKIERISGSTRYETSVEIADKFFSNPESVIIACGKDFPDGLCGSTLASTLNAPIILTDTGSSRVGVAKKYIQENDVSIGVVLGGTARIDDNTVWDILGN